MVLFCAFVLIAFGFFKDSLKTTSDHMHVLGCVIVGFVSVWFSSEWQTSPANIHSNSTFRQIDSHIPHETADERADREKRTLEWLRAEFNKGRGGQSYRPSNSTFRQIDSHIPHETATADEHPALVGATADERARLEWLRAEFNKGRGGQRK